MAAKNTRTGDGGELCLEVLTKEEKEALLSKKMEEIRKKNIALQKRHEEIEADKRRADGMGMAVTPKYDPPMHSREKSDPQRATSQITTLGAPSGQIQQRGRGKPKKITPKLQVNIGFNAHMDHVEDDDIFFQNCDAKSSANSAEILDNDNDSSVTPKQPSSWSPPKFKAHFEHDDRGSSEDRQEIMDNRQVQRRNSNTDSFSRPVSENDRPLDTLNKSSQGDRQQRDSRTRYGDPSNKFYRNRDGFVGSSKYQNDRNRSGSRSKYQNVRPGATQTLSDDARMERTWCKSDQGNEGEPWPDENSATEKHQVSNGKSPHVPISKIESEDITERNGFQNKTRSFGADTFDGKSNVFKVDEQNLGEPWPDEPVICYNTYESEKKCNISNSNDAKYDGDMNYGEPWPDDIISLEETVKTCREKFGGKYGDVNNLPLNHGAMDVGCLGEPWPDGDSVENTTVTAMDGDGSWMGSKKRDFGNRRQTNRHGNGDGDMNPGEDWPGEESFGTAVRVMRTEGVKDGNGYPDDNDVSQHSQASHQGPPPDPGYNFLSDRGREGPLAQREQEARRHPKNYGGADMESVARRMKFEKRQESRGDNSRMPMTLTMTGRERQLHAEWKQDREEVDRRRVEQQMTSSGGWKREWDSDKTQLQDEGPRSEPAKRPAGRIGSGRFDRGEDRISTVSKRDLGSTETPVIHSAPSRGRGRGRGRVRGRGSFITKYEPSPKGRQPDKSPQKVGFMSQERGKSTTFNLQMKEGQEKISPVFGSTPVPIKEPRKVINFGSPKKTINKSPPVAIQEKVQSTSPRRVHCKDHGIVVNIDNSGKKDEMVEFEYMKKRGQQRLAVDPKATPMFTAVKPDLVTDINDKKVSDNDLNEEIHPVDHDRSEIGHGDHKNGKNCVDRVVEIRVIDQDKTIGHVDKANEIGCVDQDKGVSHVKNVEIGRVDQDKGVSYVDKDEEIGRVDQDKEVSYVDKDEGIGRVDQDKEVSYVDKNEEIGHVHQVEGIGGRVNQEMDHDHEKGRSIVDNKLTQPLDFDFSVLNNTKRLAVNLHKILHGETFSLPTDGVNNPVDDVFIKDDEDEWEDVDDNECGMSEDQGNEELEKVSQDKNIEEAPSVNLPPPSNAITPESAQSTSSLTPLETPDFIKDLGNWADEMISPPIVQEKSSFIQNTSAITTSSLDDSLLDATGTQNLSASSNDCEKVIGPDGKDFLRCKLSEVFPDDDFDSSTKSLKNFDNILHDRRNLDELHELKKELVFGTHDIANPTEVEKGDDILKSSTEEHDNLDLTEQLGCMRICESTDGWSDTAHGSVKEVPQSSQDDVERGIVKFEGVENLDSGTNEVTLDSQDAFGCIGSKLVDRDPIMVDVCNAADVDSKNGDDDDDDDEQGNANLSSADIGDGCADVDENSKSFLQVERQKEHKSVKMCDDGEHNRNDIEGENFNERECIEVESCDQSLEAVESEQTDSVSLEKKGGFSGKKPEICTSVVAEGTVQESACSVNHCEKFPVEDIRNRPSMENYQEPYSVQSASGDQGVSYDEGTEGCDNLYSEGYTVKHERHQVSDEDEETKKEHTAMFE